MFTVLFVGLLPGLHAQLMGEYLGDETVLYAETKQVNQFFRRFNGEEGAEGLRYYPNDTLYRDRRVRDHYLKMLFDDQNSMLTWETKQKFIRYVNPYRHGQYLDFHGGEWFAEVQTTFMYQGKSELVTLFLELEESKVGSKWVFTNVFFAPFTKLFATTMPDGKVIPFLHPLSHELDFMNLLKVFRNQDEVSLYAEKAYQPDYLTLFLYEIKKGNLKFQTVNQVKFHFFQIEGWYFELKDIQRSGPNRGWLITQMLEIPEGQKEKVLQFIYHQ
ncbi:MAG: hypothetical protein AAFR61_19665 [Bacteroidota bacterium]